MEQNLIAAELARIEEEAAHKTKLLLNNQDAYLRMHALAAILTAHGAPQDMRGHVVYHDNHADMIIYATMQHNDPEAVLNAVQDTHLPYRITKGYDNDVRYALVEGYEDVEIVLPASLFPDLQLAA